MDHAAYDAGMDTHAPAGRVAKQIRDAFDDYHARFAAISRRAQRRFETRDWTGARADASERLDLYDACIDECGRRLAALLGTQAHDRALWGAVRGAYATLIDELFGDRTGLDQGQPAIEVALGKLRLGARIRKLTVGLCRHRFEGAGIDEIKQVTGVDHVAVLELDIGDEAADTRLDLHLLDRLEAAGELVPIGDGALQRLRDGDRRRRRRGRCLRRLSLATAECSREQDDRDPDAGK